MWYKLWESLWREFSCEVQSLERTWRVTCFDISRNPVCLCLQWIWYCHFGIGKRRESEKSQFLNVSFQIRHRLWSQQKRWMAKKYYVWILCVLTGDGGNDVSMIQAANVGVGIIGKVCMGLFCLTLCSFFDSGPVLFPGPVRPPGQARPFFFDDRPGPAMLASILFRGPGRPKVGSAVDFGRYRPRPRPALFVFANGVGKRCAR